MELNLHKDSENYYRKMLLLLRPFKTSEIYLKNDEDSWKIAYMKGKDNIEMIQKIYIFKFNNINKNDDEWNNSK